MNNIKTFSLLNPFSDPDSTWRMKTSVQNEHESYARIPLVYRALNIRCDTLVNVPRYIYRGEDEIDAYEFERDLPLRDLLWLTEAAYLLRGAGWILKKSNAYGIKKGLRWLNPFSMQWQLDGERLVFWQQIQDTGRRYPLGGKTWTADDFLFFKSFNPMSDLEPGPSAASVALSGAQIIGNVSTFLSKFFEADALPVTMIMMPQGTNSDQVKYVEGWFQRKLQGLKSATQKILGVTGDIKIEKLTSELSSFAFDRVDDHAIKEIAWAFGIPKTVLTADSANRATAETEYGTFLSNTIIPRCSFYESVLNPFLEEYDQRIEFAPEEMSELQIDETSRAASLKGLVDAGIPLKAALDILGYDLSEEAEALIEESEKQKEERAAVVPVPPAVPQTPATEGTPPEPNAQDQTKAELDRWMRKALKSLKSGGSALVDFQTDLISEAVQTGLIASLANASTAEEVKSIFAKVK
jgi:HK97 family phage portal protein